MENQNSYFSKLLKSGKTVKKQVALYLDEAKIERIDMIVKQFSTISDARSFSRNTLIEEAIDKFLEESEKFLLEAIEVAPRDIQSRTELGRLLSKQKGREGEAEKFLLEAIEIYPEHLHSRTVLARLYEKMNRLPEAKRLYQELCNIDPGNRFGVEGLSRLK